MKSRNGSTMVEMALAFPILVIASLIVFDISQLILHQNILDHAAHELARSITNIPGTSEPELNAFATDWIGNRFQNETQIELNIQVLPQLSPVEPGRNPSLAHIVNLSLKQKPNTFFLSIKDLWLKTHIRKIRVF